MEIEKTPEKRNQTTEKEASTYNITCSCGGVVIWSRTGLLL
jgi:hypothetical protein